MVTDVHHLGFGAMMTSQRQLVLEAATQTGAVDPDMMRVPDLAGTLLRLSRN